MSKKRNRLPLYRCDDCDVVAGWWSKAGLPMTECSCGSKNIRLVKTSSKRKESIEKTLSDRSDIHEKVRHIKRLAYRRDNVPMNVGELTIATNLLNEFGDEKLALWYRMACERRVTEWNAIKYVCGIARNEREHSPA